MYDLSLAGHVLNQKVLKLLNRLIVMLMGTQYASRSLSLKLHKSHKITIETSWHAMAGTNPALPILGLCSLINVVTPVTNIKFIRRSMVTGQSVRCAKDSMNCVDKSIYGSYD